MPMLGSSDRSSGSGSGASAAIFVVPLLILLSVIGVSGIVFRASPLPRLGDRERPMLWRDPRLGEVDAFLWQDPIAAVASVDAEREDGERLLQQWLLPSPGDATERRLALVMITSGSAWPTAEENRIRQRFAITSALSEVGFQPLRRRSLAYLKSRELAIDRSPPPESGHAAPSSPAALLPYEWYTAGTQPGVQSAIPFQRVLVLWVREDQLRGAWGAKLPGLVDDLAKADLRNAYSFAGLTGSSDFLAELAQQTVDAGPMVNARPRAWWSNISRSMGEAARQAAAARSEAAGALARPIAPNGPWIIDYFDWSSTIGTTDLLARSPAMERFRSGATFSFERGGRLYRLRRTIGTDRDLLALIAEELALRGIELRKGDGAVAVIREQDTLYGRRLPKTLRQVLGRDDAVEEYSFLMGVDGRLPGDKVTVAGQAQGRSDAVTLGDLLRAQPADTAEMPFGRDQFDYLRRVVGGIRERAVTDMPSAPAAPDGTGRQLPIRAVGVLCTLWEDKIPIIQAVREAMPDVPIFTTDMDAHFAHGTFGRACRNLLVASHYDLRLGPELQAQTPPFRFSYQTALFLATLCALQHQPAVKALDERDLHGRSDVARTRGDSVAIPGESVARVYEIGLRGAVDLPMTRAEARDRDAAAALFPQRTPPLRDRLASPPLGAWWAVIGLVICALPFSLAPAVGIWRQNTAWSDRWRLLAPPLSAIAAAAILIVVAAGGGSRLAILACCGTTVLLAMVSVGIYATHMLRRPSHWEPLKPAIRPAWPPRDDWAHLLGPSGWLTLTATILATTIAAVVIVFVDGAPGQEPVAFLSGISVWPSELIRICTVLFAILSLLWIWEQSRRNQVELTARLGLGAAAQRAAAPPLDEALSPLRALRRRAQACLVLHWRVPAGSPGTAVWQRYLRLGRIGPRTVRTCVLMLLVLAGTWPFVGSLMEVPYIARGEVARTTNALLGILAWLSTLFVTIAVWDAANLCTRFIDNLSTIPLERRWPRSAVNWVRSARGLDGLAAQAWLTVRIVAERTRAVAWTVYIPVILLIMLAASNASLFDAWPFRWTALVTLAVPAILALVAAQTLRRAAAFLRSRQLGELDALRDRDLLAIDQDLGVLRTLMTIESKADAASVWRSAVLMEMDLDPGGGEPPRSTPVVVRGGETTDDRLTLHGESRNGSRDPVEMSFGLGGGATTVRLGAASARLVAVRLQVGDAKVQYVPVQPASGAPPAGEPVAVFPSTPPSAERPREPFERAAREIRAIDFGAYSGPLGNPVFNAALLPFGGIGLYELGGLVAGLL